MNPLALLKMMGFDPDQVMGELDKFRDLSHTVETRVAAIEEKLDRAIALLEGLHDANAEYMQLDCAAVDSTKHNELKVINGGSNDH